MSMRRNHKPLMKKIQAMNYAQYTPQEIRDRLGISTMSLMTDSDPNLGVDRKALGRAVEAGARKIEIGADFGPSHFPYQNREAVKELKKLYDDHGAEIYSIHSPYGRDPREWDFDQVKKLVDAMVLVGAKVLLLHFVFVGRQQWDAAMEAMHRLIRLCESHDIWLTIETDTDMWFDASFADWFEFPRVGICCDTGHTGAYHGGWNVLENPYNAIYTMSTANGKLNHLHLSDVSLKPLARPHKTKTLPPRLDHWSPGLGCSHWGGVMLAVKAMDYPGAFMFEIWTEDKDRFERLAAFPERLAGGELGKIEG